MNNNFCAFILSHGRPDRVKTYKTLRKSGYSGRIIIIVDNEDKTINRYIDNFGEKNVFVFDKKYMSKTFDEADNFKNRKSIVYARNYCFILAKELGIKYFIQLDDDYYWFGHRGVKGAITTKKLDLIFNYLYKDIKILFSL